MFFEGRPCLLPVQLHLPSSGLEQQLEQLHAENKMTHEEARFLSTYMDHEYPVKSVQIASHMRQLQQAKDDQKVEQPLTVLHLTMCEAGPMISLLLLVPRTSWITSVRCVKWSLGLCLI